MEFSNFAPKVETNYSRSENRSKRLGELV